MQNQRRAISLLNNFISFTQSLFILSLNKNCAGSVLCKETNPIIVNITVQNKHNKLKIEPTDIKASNILSEHKTNTLRL